MKSLMLITALTVLSLSVAGCRIDESKGDKDKAKEVNITTPLGGMHVKSNHTVDAEDLGVTPYPGATAVLDPDSDEKSANVDLHFGDFRMRAVVSKFHTNDAPDAVLAFYQKDLKRYGDVLECRNGKAVGSKTATSLGLTCEGNDHSKGTQQLAVLKKGQQELRAGSEQHQHIVTLQKTGNGTDFTVIALDLPNAGSDAD